MQVEHLDDGSKRLTVTAELPDWVYELKDEEEDKFLAQIKQDINYKYWEIFNWSILNPLPVIKIN